MTRRAPANGRDVETDTEVNLESFKCVVETKLPSTIAVAPGLRAGLEAFFEARVCVYHTFIHCRIVCLRHVYAQILSPIEIRPC